MSVHRPVVRASSLCEETTPLSPSVKEATPLYIEAVTSLTCPCISVYIWYIFGLFSISGSILSMFLVYFHDLILCFLNMINMMLSAYYMCSLFYVEVCEYMKWNYLFTLYVLKCVFLMHMNCLVAYMWIISCIIIIKLTYQVPNLRERVKTCFVGIPKSGLYH